MIYLIISIYIFIVFITYKIIYQDNTKNHPLPELDSFSALEIAFLRGGNSALLRTLLFDLYEKQEIEIIQSDNHAYIKIKHNISEKNILENVILNFLRNTPKANDIFSKKFKITLNHYISPIIHKLEGESLLISPILKAWHHTVFLSSLFLVFMIALLHNHYWWYAFITGLILFFLYPFKKYYPSYLGKHYIKALKKYYNSKNNELVYRVALEGIGILEYQTKYQPLIKVLNDITD